MLGDSLVSLFRGQGKQTLVPESFPNKNPLNAVKIQPLQADNNLVLAIVPEGAQLSLEFCRNEIKGVRTLTVLDEKAFKLKQNAHFTRIYADHKLASYKKISLYVDELEQFYEIPVKDFISVAQPTFAVICKH